jgi:hypothetical protein
MHRAQVICLQQENCPHCAPNVMEGKYFCAESIFLNAHNDVVAGLGGLCLQLLLVSPFCWRVRRCESMHDIFQVCHLLTRYGKVGFVNSVVPQCPSLLQPCATPWLCLLKPTIHKSCAVPAHRCVPHRLCLLTPTIHVEDLLSSILQEAP